jgi:sugar/nucleoside kinase (ribokinase family)
VGDLLLDVAVRIEGDQVPRADTDSVIEVRRGGSAASVAVAVVGAGARARFVGMVGDDPAGRLVVDELEAAGVEVVVRRTGRTGTVVSLVHPDGERSMLTDRGVADGFGPLPAPLLADVAAVHVPAYGLLGSAPSAAAGTALGAPQVLRCLDVSSVTLLADGGAAQLADVVAGSSVDLVVANEEEARALGWPGDWLPAAGARVVKLGAAGAEVDEGGRRRRHPTTALAGVDTTGAGDAFAGGLLAALVGGGGIDDAVRYGHAAARRLLQARRT